MEVHHHSGHAKKKWTEYIWEFLMLFLAVFCGFLAENQREHMIEHQREKKYIRSLLADLKGDTAEIRSVITYSINKFHGLDTLMSALNTLAFSEQDQNEIYRLNSNYASNIYAMIFNDRTMRQLLNSGNMRLVGKQSISDSIINYYGQAKDDVLAQEKVYAEFSMRLVYLGEEIFDKTLWPLKIDDNNKVYRETKPGNRKLLTRDKTILKRYAQMVSTAQSALAVYLNQLFDMKERSGRLLSFLETEYNLK